MQYLSFTETERVQFGALFQTSVALNHECMYWQGSRIDIMLAEMLVIIMNACARNKEKEAGQLINFGNARRKGIIVLPIPTEMYNAVVRATGNNMMCVATGDGVQTAYYATRTDVNGRVRDALVRNGLLNVRFTARERARLLRLALTIAGSENKSRFF